MSKGLKTLIPAVMVAVLLVVGAPLSSADTIEATVINVIAFGRVDVSLDSGVTWDNGQYAGSISMTRTGGTSTVELAPNAINFVVFCMEPREPISAGVTYEWDVKELSQGNSSLGGIGTTKANQLRELMAEVHPAMGATLTNAQALAIQIAIWEIVEESSGSLNVSNGSARFRNANRTGALALAQDYLDLVDGDVPATSLLLTMWNDGQQDLLIQTTPNSFPATEVPEPATLSLVGLTLIGCGVIRRRAARG